MKSTRKFVLLVDVDNTQLQVEQLAKIVERVESYGTINYIKLYGVNDKRLKAFTDLVVGRCCDVAPLLRSKLKSRKSILDTRIIVDAIKIAGTNIADSFAIVAGEGDYGYMLSALKAMDKFIAGRFNNDINLSFCDVFLWDTEQM